MRTWILGGASCFFLTVVASGCEGGVDGGPHVVAQAEDSSGVQVVTVHGDVVGLPDWVVLESQASPWSAAERHEFGEVGEAVFLGDGALVVYDRQAQELTLFPADGRSARVLSSGGSGPGENVRLSSLSVVPGDTVWAFDRGQLRLLSFTRDGAPGDPAPEVARMPAAGRIPLDAWALGRGRWLVSSALPAEPAPPEAGLRRVSRRRSLELLDRDRAAPVARTNVDSEFNVRGERGEAATPFSHRLFVAVSGGQIAHGSGESYEIAVRDADLRLIRLVRWPDWPNVGGDAVADSFRLPMEESLARLEALDPTSAEWLIEAVFSSAGVPESLPALGDLLLDNQGRMWVSRFRPQTDLFKLLGGIAEQWDQRDVWHVLDRDGSPLARVRLPSQTRLLAVQDDRVALVSRDSLGVGRVSVAELVAGGRAGSPR